MLIARTCETMRGPSGVCRGDPGHEIRKMLKASYIKLAQLHSLGREAVAMYSNREATVKSHPERMDELRRRD